MQEHSDTHPAAPVASGETHEDPVCGMTVAGHAAHRADHQGREYVFCSAGCLEKFEKDPARFIHDGDEDTGELTALAAPEADASDAPGAGTWTCPMHPQVVEDGPGSCPICGMALEPRSAAAGQSDENPELRDMTRRFWVSVALTVPLHAGQNTARCRARAGVERPFSQRIMGTGNIILEAIDSTSPVLRITGLKTDVIKLYEALRVATEAAKQRRGVRVVDYGEPGVGIPG